MFKIVIITINEVIKTYQKTVINLLYLFNLVILENSIEAKYF